MNCGNKQLTSNGTWGVCVKGLDATTEEVTITASGLITHARERDMAKPVFCSGCSKPILTNAERKRGCARSCHGGLRIKTYHDRCAPEDAPALVLMNNFHPDSNSTVLTLNFVTKIRKTQGRRSGLVFACQHCGLGDGPMDSCKFQFERDGGVQFTVQHKTCVARYYQSKEA